MLRSDFVGEGMDLITKPLAVDHLAAKVREMIELHRRSKTSSASTSVISGLGPYGYIVAMQAALQALGKLPDKLLNCLRPQFS
jgi:3-dehydroquinate dehydratase-2